jgi:hypothetical protein
MSPSLTSKQGRRPASYLSYHWVQGSPLLKGGVEPGRGSTFNKIPTFPRSRSLPLRSALSSQDYRILSCRESSRDLGFFAKPMPQNGRPSFERMEATSRDEKLDFAEPVPGFHASIGQKCSSTATMRVFTLTTEPSGRGNSDTEDPLFRPARPSYSRDSVCFPRCSEALAGRPDRFAPSQAP